MKKIQNSSSSFTLRYPVLTFPIFPNVFKCLLLGLAIYDLMVLLLVMLLKGFPTFLETSYHVYFLPIFHPLMNIAWTGSIFFTVFMTLERFIAVTQPMKSKGLFDLQKVKYQMGLITLFVIIYNIPRFIEYKWKDIRIRSAYDPEGIEKPEFRQRGHLKTMATSFDHLSFLLPMLTFSSLNIDIVVIHTT